MCRKKAECRTVLKQSICDTLISNCTCSVVLWHSDRCQSLPHVDEQPRCYSWLVCTHLRSTVPGDERVDNLVVLNSPNIFRAVKRLTRILRAEKIRRKKTTPRAMNIASCMCGRLWGVFLGIGQCVTKKPSSSPVQWTLIKEQMVGLDKGRYRSVGSEVAGKCNVDGMLQVSAGTATRRL
jgi:hypothetical protein